jgi:hypothetical protein
MAGPKIPATSIALKDGPCTILSGSGNPEGVVTGAPGDVFVSADGNLYQKDAGSGTDATGWSAKVRAGAGSTRTIEVVIDGGGSALTTGIKADRYVPYACTITAVTMLADQSGSCVVDIWKDTYANYPPTVADTITAAAKPTISAATNSQDTTLTGWTTSISAGDTLRFNIDSAATLTRLTLTLTVTI